MGGARCNAVAPLAYTRMTESLWGIELFPADRLPELEPANVAVVVGWLASPASEGVPAKVLAVSGSRCTPWQGWQPVAEVTTGGAWTFDGSWPPCPPCSTGSTRDWNRRPGHRSAPRTGWECDDVHVFRILNRTYGGSIGNCGGDWTCVTQ